MLNHTTIMRPPMVTLLLPVLLCALLQSGCRKNDPPPHAGKSDSSGAITLTDAIGQRLTLSTTPRRVISLAPNITEMIHAIGAGDMLIGRTTYCDYPPEAAKAPAVGDLHSLRYETIISLKPDLLLMSLAGNIDANYWKLRDLGLQVFALGAEDVNSTIATIDTVGILLGRRAEAERVSGRLRRQVDSVRALAAGKPRVTAFVVIDKAPLVTASNGFIAEALGIAGGENIAAGESTAYPTYSREELLRQDPEVILVPGNAWEEIEDLLRRYPEWKNLRAVRAKRVYLVPYDISSRPGPRLGLGIGMLYEALHGATPQEVMGRYMPGQR